MSDYPCTFYEEGHGMYCQVDLNLRELNTLIKALNLLFDSLLAEELGKPLEELVKLHKKLIEHFKRLFLVDTDKRKVVK